MYAMRPKTVCTGEDTDRNTATFFRPRRDYCVWIAHRFETTVSPDTQSAGVNIHAPLRTRSTFPVGRQLRPQSRVQYKAVPPPPPPHPQRSINNTNNDRGRAHPGRTRAIVLPTWRHADHWPADALNTGHSPPSGHLPPYPENRITDICLPEHNRNTNLTVNPNCHLSLIVATLAPNPNTTLTLIT